MPRDFRRSRATDEEEMMEIHLQSQMGGGGRTAFDTGYSVDYNNSGGLKCSFKSGQFLFLHLFIKKIIMSLNHSYVNR